MTQTSTKNIAKQAATIGGGLAAAFLPQYCSADIVTVGGDGGTGSVTLATDDESTNLGGVLGVNVNFTNTSEDYAYLGPGSYNMRLFPAVRSSQSNPGVESGRWFTFISEGEADEGAILNSADNWVPGLFSVNGVNDNDVIWGWMHVELGSLDSPSARIISFTYDDEATDTTAFTKPVGGFSVTAVPEPSGFAFLALLAAGAGGLGRYRQS